MLNAVSFLVELISERTIWLYLACGLGLLCFLHAYISARRQRGMALFQIPKEVAAHKESRAVSGIGVMLGLAVVVFALKNYVLPTVELPEPEPTATLAIPLATPTYTPTPMPTPTATPAEEEARPTATPLPPPTPVPEPTIEEESTREPPPEPPPAPAACPDPNVRITHPGAGATVSGVVAVMGTANHAQFQFYKVEWGQGHDPTAWHVIDDVRRQPVTGGTLVQFNTAAVPNGPITIQLVVVDITGNYPAPCRVRLTVQN